MNLLLINKYIKDLYRNQKNNSQSQYINKTELKEFIPVVDEDVARLLKILLKVTHAKRVLEIGTSIGYSTTSMAKVVKKNGGKIITVEYDHKVAEQAQRNFERAGIADVIEIKIGDALQIVPNLNGEFDFIFQDVDKRLYSVLFDDCVRLLKKGGLFVAEDTLFPVIDLDPKWQYLIPHIEKFNKLVVGSSELDSIILPIGDGVTIALKIEDKNFHN